MPACLDVSIAGNRCPSRNVGHPLGSCLSLSSPVGSRPLTAVPAPYLVSSPESRPGSLVATPLAARRLVRSRAERRRPRRAGHRPTGEPVDFGRIVIDMPPWLVSMHLAAAFLRVPRCSSALINVPSTFISCRTPRQPDDSFYRYSVLPLRVTKLSRLCLVTFHEFVGSADPLVACPFQRICTRLCSVLLYSGLSPSQP